MEIGDAFRTRIEGRIGEAIDKYFDGGFSGRVNVVKSGSRFTADCMIHLDSGMELQATGDAQEPTAAFEAAADRFEKRLRRYKRRLKSHGPGANGNSTDIAYTVMAPIAEDDEEVPEDYAPAIVAEIDCRAEDDVGRFGGHRTRYQGQSRFRVPQRRKRSREHRLSPGRRKHRLDRSVDGGSPGIDSLSTEPRGGGALAAGADRAEDTKSMDLSDLIEAPAIMPALKANSKKQLLQLLSEKAAVIAGIPEREIFDTILQRERLGSTGVGNGIAIPHGKLAGVKRIVGVFARLDQPVDFEALDDQPVDLVFLLLAPEGAGADHLKALSRIARVLRDADTVAKIRGTKDAAAIHAFLASTPASHAA